MTTHMRIFTCLAALLATMLMASAAASQAGTEAVPEAAVPSAASPLLELDAARQGQHTRLPPFDFSPAPPASVAAPVQSTTAGLETAFAGEQHKLGRYAKWGMLIGGAAGLGYGLATDEGGLFDLSPVLETVIGVGIGLYSGGALDLLHSLRGRGGADQ